MKAFIGLLYIYFTCQLPILQFYFDKETIGVRILKKIRNVDF